MNLLLFPVNNSNKPYFLDLNSKIDVPNLISVNSLSSVCFELTSFDSTIFHNLFHLYLLGFSPIPSAISFLPSSSINALSREHRFKSEQKTRISRSFHPLMKFFATLRSTTSARSNSIRHPQNSSTTTLPPFEVKETQ